MTATPTPRTDCRYAFPVRFRTANYGSSHHDYPATDLFAPRGTVVVAVTDSVVDWVTSSDEWDPKTDDPATRGGLSVAIIGRDGVRYYYSHLLDVADGLAVGVAVSVGRPLGHIDSSGNARGIAPHLHFGISHPTRPDDWRVRRGEISPYRYLNAWRDRRQLSPVVPGASSATCLRVV